MCVTWTYVCNVYNNWYHTDYLYVECFKRSSGSYNKHYYAVKTLWIILYLVWLCVPYDHVHLHLMLKEVNYAITVVLSVLFMKLQMYRMGRHVQQTEEYEKNGEFISLEKKLSIFSYGVLLIYIWTLSASKDETFSSYRCSLPASNCNEISCLK